MGSPPTLDIDLLRTFTLIAEGRSFSRAAERVGRTQSAVSLQLQRLESLVGHRLVERGRGRDVGLTVEGEYLLERARNIMALNDDIIAAFTADPASRETMAGGEAAGEPTFANRPSIAVLPFDNLSDDAGHQYFVDGFVDDLITSLSRLKWLLVIARNSSFAYGGTGVDARRVGRELGVKYVLAGSLRKCGDRLRIKVQLLDAATAALLLADQCDRRLDAMFEWQDDLVDQVTSLIAPGLRRSEIHRARRKRSGSLDAYDLYLRALPHTAARMPAGTAIAIPLLEQALKLDPDYAPAHALMAWCYEWRYTRGGFDAANRRSALAHADEVLASHTDDADTLAIAGFVDSLLSDERDAGLGAIGEALRLNASSVLVLYLASHAYAIANQTELAVSLSDRAFRLSPFDPLAFEANMALGDAAMGNGRYADAAACFGRAARINPKYSTAIFFEAMATALATTPDDALPIVRRGLRLEPDFRTRIVFEVGMSPPLTVHFVEGGRRLGLPS